MALINRLLPGPAPGGDEAQPGRDNESKWAPSALTKTTYEAAERNNEM